MLERKTHGHFSRIKLPAAFLLVILLVILPLAASASVLTFYAGTGEFGYKDGKRLEAAFRFPYGLAVDKDNQIIVADSYNNRIRKIVGNEVTTMAGFSDSTDAFGFPSGGYTDGEAAKARFKNPRDLVVDSANNIYVADTGNHAIRKISGGKVSTLAGTGRPGFQDGQGNKAQFNAPSGLAIDEKNNLYVSDTLNNVIRKITPNGVVSTFAGKQSVNGGFQDGLSSRAQFNEPAGIALAGDGTLYVLDSGNQLVRKIKDLQVSTIAGFRDSTESLSDYTPGDYRDGTWTEARFNFPKGIDVAPNGTIFIADTWNHRVRALTPQGEVFTLAGTGKPGHIGDSLMLNGPAGILYHSGTLYISDTWNNALRALPLDLNNLPRMMVTQRLSGDTRYDTAAAISTDGWQASDTVILASGENFPDALAGTTLAGFKEAPVLLTAQGTLYSKTLTEIKRLKPKDIYILGGTSVISKAIEDGLAHDYNVTRLFGTDRYETAVKIGQFIIASKDSETGNQGISNSGTNQADRTSAVDTVILATGSNYPDALSIAPFAGQYTLPILFTEKTILNTYTRQAISEWGIKNVILTGGTAVISEEIENLLKNELQIKVTRLSGEDRYQTSLEVAKYFENYQEGISGETKGTARQYKKAALATGENFPDALAGASHAAKGKYPVLLVKKENIHPEIKNYLKELGLEKLYVYGGKGVITDKVKEEISSGN